MRVWSEQENEGAAVQPLLVLVTPRNRVMTAVEELSSVSHLEAQPEPGCTDTRWHRRVISAPGVAQTVSFCVFLIGQKLSVCGESAGEGQFPDLTFSGCQEEECRDSTAEPRRSFTLRNLFSRFLPPLCVYKQFCFPWICPLIKATKQIFTGIHL